MSSLRDAKGPCHPSIPPRGARTWRLVTDEFGYQEWRHRCAICKTWKTVECFYIKRYSKGYKWESYCKPCKVLYNRQKIIQDQETHRSYLEERRIRYHDDRRRRGLKCYPQKGVRSLAFPEKENRRELLPVGPISEWVTQKAKVYGGNKQLAKYCGVDERTITRLASKEYSETTFALVDEILTREGSTFIWDLYPVEYEKLLEVA